MNSEGIPVPVSGYALPPQHLPPHILDAANAASQQRQQPQVKQPVPQQPHSAAVQENPAAGINFLQVSFNASLRNVSPFIVTLILHLQESQIDMDAPHMDPAVVVVQQSPPHHAAVPPPQPQPAVSRR